MIRILSLVLMLAPTAGLAQAQFQIPEGCTPKFTVQSKGCRMSNHWICEADTNGEQWRVDIGANGPTYVGKIDFEARWIESFDLIPGVRSWLKEPSEDDASFSELLEAGLDSYNFKTETSTGEIEQVVGFDRIVDTDVIIDGEPLLATEFQTRITLDDGTVKWEARGREFISSKHRKFFSGNGEYVTDRGAGEFDFSPVEFIYPGEPGFFGMRPKFDCPAIDARFVPQVTPDE